MNRAAVHTGLFYAAIFSAFAGVLPFWPVWMEDWGLTPAEVGTITGFGIIARTIGGLMIPVLADRLDARRKVAMACGLIGAAIFLAHYWFETKFLILMGMIGLSACIAGLMPISEALGSVAARQGGFSYSKVRAMGSLSFLVAATVLGALVGWWGSDVALFWIVISMVIASLLARRHPGGGKVTATPPGFRDIAGMLTNKVFLVFAIVVAFAQGSHAVYYAFASIHWRNLGIGEAEIGMLWSFGVVAETILMLSIGEKLVRWLGPIRLMGLGTLGAVLRWGWMVADPTGLSLWAAQALHAVTFALSHLGAIAFIATAIPERYTATAQGATGAMAAGVSSALMTFLAASLYPELGGGTYLIGAVAGLLGFWFVVVLALRWRGEELRI